MYHTKRREKPILTPDLKYSALDPCSLSSHSTQYLDTGSAPCIIHSQKRDLVRPLILSTVQSVHVHRHITPNITQAVHHVLYTMKELSRPLTQGTWCTFAMVCLRSIFWMSSDQLVWERPHDVKCFYLSDHNPNVSTLGKAAYGSVLFAIELLLV